MRFRSAQLSLAAKISKSIYGAVHFTRRLVSARASFIKADFSFNFNRAPVQFYVSSSSLARARASEREPTERAGRSPFFLLLHTLPRSEFAFCPSATFTHSLNFLANYGNPFWPSGLSLLRRSMPISIPCIIHSSLRRESRDVAIHLGEELVPIMSDP